MRRFTTRIIKKVVHKNKKGSEKKILFDSCSKKNLKKVEHKIKPGTFNNSIFSPHWRCFHGDEL